MKLFEFFGAHQPTTDSTDELSGKTEKDQEKLGDEIFWFMLDDDSLHKKYFIPLAQEAARLMKADKFDAKKFNPKWMPMVNQACLRYYKEQELSGDPRDEFSFDLRKGLCCSLGDHCYEDIRKGEYKLGI